VLVGMMATGKTSVARQIARRLGRRVYDSDAMITARTGQTVAQLFEAGGEPAFRDLETEVLDEAVDADPPGVVAAAGGVVLSPANRDRLRAVSRSGGVVVWLTADPAVLAARVHPGDHRPLLADDPAGTLARLSAERGPLYAEVADRTVDTGKVPFGRMVDEVLDAVRAVAREHGGARP
ncbi:MAG TPA: shikimate kinase, partial [Acidimicrobiia bacterium]|nr:shikimate kinase [Acidimicrobiia bacterium]